MYGKTSFGSNHSNIYSVTINPNGSVIVAFRKVKATTAKAVCESVRASKVIIDQSESGSAYVYRNVPMIVRRRIMANPSGRNFNRMFKAGRGTRGDFGCERIGG